MMMKTWMVLVAAATLCGSAEGAVIGTATLVKDPGNGVPFASPDAALGSPWVSYVLDLQSTAGELIAGVDATITGLLHQRWVRNEDTKVFDGTPNSLNLTNGDSHLRAAAGQTLFGLGPSENNSGIGSPLADTAFSDYGVGSQMRGAWGVIGAFQKTSIGVAYIVIPKGQFGAIDIDVLVADPHGNIIGHLTERSFFPTVPEPSSAVLLGAGLLGCSWLGWRRKSSGGFRLASVVRTASVAALVALVGGSANAAVIGTATLKGNPPGVAFTSPDAALGSPWVSYALGLQSTAGELIGGIDVEITGTLHQRWTFNEDSGTFDQTANSANQTNGDSHLRAVTGALFGAGPSEDNSGIGSPLPDSATSNYGVGSFLKGAWGIISATTTASLAYIVVPKDQLTSLRVNVKVANPSGDIIGVINSCDFFLCAPAPAIIGVSGNGVPIADGDTTPSFLDSTDFGSVWPYPPFNQDANRTFTITASGDSALEFGTPVFSGPFSILGDFPSLIPAGSSASFKVQLNPDVLFGNHYGTISIPNSSTNAPVFDFSLHAAVPEPASGMLLGLGLLAITITAFQRERVG